MAVDGKTEELIVGEKLLVIIIFVGTAILAFILWTNRHILRMFLISKKGPHTNVGNDSPKELKKTIEKYFNLISKIVIEPKLLCDPGNKDLALSSYVETRDESTYIFRRKAFDLMRCLDDLLCRVDVCLTNKHGQTIREHFTDLQNPPYAPFENCEEICERVVDKYEHARYSCKNFDSVDYEIFAADMDTLTMRVYSKFPVPGTLLLPAGNVDKARSGSQESSEFDRELSQGILNIELNEEPKMDLRHRDNKISLA